ncbi:uncharacterized protein CTRU02_208542 [Colletotrichum truncatum]|uniref:Uncharacterized protein n=1 Tax=Colletotrichum truncatum TaxID=5467 RepID=A0ACC3YWT3_COLTU|nr:uncharacterized protein CTRU02_10299 [Colletotrichum truncatum]KAF6787503.1 hypothetical protein CTRU02_10299 [Colletotrichum truncatum]
MMPPVGEVAQDARQTHGRAYSKCPTPCGWGHYPRVPREGPARAERIDLPRVPLIFQPFGLFGRLKLCAGSFPPIASSASTRDRVSRSSKLQCEGITSC